MGTYMQGVLQKANAVFMRADPVLAGQSIAADSLIRSRFLFNPELNSRWFIVPALSTIIIGLLAIVLTALTVAKEWETALWNCCSPRPCVRRKSCWAN